MSVAGKLSPQAPGVRMRMLIANPKCLPCARHFATLLSWTREFPLQPHSLTPMGWMESGLEWNRSVHLTVPRVYSLYRAIHTCLASRKGHRASSVPGPLLALPWLGMIPPLLSLEYRTEPGLGWKLTRKHPQLHLVCPLSLDLGHLLSASLLSPCWLCPVVPKTTSRFLCLELGEDDNYYNVFSHPFKPLKVQPGTKSTLATPFLSCCLFSFDNCFFPFYL